MRVSYSYNNSLYNAEANSSSFILSNKHGGFFIQGIESQYRGLFFNINGEMYKVVDMLNIEGNIDSLQLDLDDVSIKRGSLRQNLFMPIGANALVVECNESRFMDIILDVKKAYDSRQWGRNYSIEYQDNRAIISFTKKTDKREDNDENREEYKIFIVIEGIGDIEFQQIDRWSEQHYALDSKRGENSSRYVYEALRIRSEKVVITAGMNRHSAISDADYVMGNIEDLKELSFEKLGPYMNNLNAETETAFEAAKNSLNMLTDEVKKGIYAGLPWFFQFWSRDELISLKGLILGGKYEFTKELLMKHLDNIDEFGRLPNRFPSTKTGSADAIGWYAFRWLEFLKELAGKEKLKDVLSKEEIISLSFKLKDSFSDLKNNFFIDGMFYNNAQETWMDSVWEEDNRQGFSIEIQALMLRYMELLQRLLGKDAYQDEIDELRKKIRQEFFKDGYLYDGKDDPTIRPNVFLAAYIYPNLLSREEWKECLRIVLPRLWLDWGGLSSISKDSRLYSPENTGTSTKSYHRGDSWYWINNIAAIVLERLGGEEFHGYVNKILEASTNELLYNGLLGNCAEISSSVEMRSEGCLMQAWSAATYIELINELFG